MSKKNITYLLGAGASANAIPTINEFSESFLEIRNQIEREVFADILNKIGNKSTHEIKTELLNDFDWLYKNSTKHSTIDTYAKKLFLNKNKGDLKRLKDVLSLYFLFKQNNTEPDKRYDTFYASILNDGLKIPEHINIISWNYDLQIEMSYKEYDNNSSLGYIQGKLNIFPCHDTVYQDADKYKIKLNSSNIIKLNGTAGQLIDGSGLIGNLHDFKGTTPERLKGEKYLNMYIQLKEHKKSLLNFAWENDTLWNSIVNETSNTIAANTEILVIIGYTFPYFNREVDKKIMGAMTKLQRIYYQLPEKDLENIPLRLQALRTDKVAKEITKWADIEEFCLPYEL